MLKGISFIFITMISINIGIIACSSRVLAKEVNGIQVNFSIPLVSGDGSLIENKSHFNVFHFRNLIMYEFRNMVDSIGANGIVFSGHRSNYFVYHKDSVFGKSFRSVDDSNNFHRYPVDSLLKQQALQNFQWHLVKGLDLVDSSFDSNSGDVKMVYKAKANTGKGSKDSIIFYYNKSLNDLQYSFSKELDTERGAKLYKIRLKYDSSYNEVQKMTFPKRETYFEMKGIKVENHSRLKSIFELYAAM